MRLSTTLLVALSTLSLSAQIGRKELHTDSGLVVLHQFMNGGVSTKEWRDKDERFGLTTAYDHTGKEIFRYGTRRIGGHASVHFSYHANGAVSKAEASDAPDAGIQWYRSTTTFDDQGNRTGFSEEGRDNYGPLHSPNRWLLQQEAPAVDTVPPKPEVVVCQKLFVNEVFVVNSTRETAVIRCTPKHPSPALPAGEHLLGAGDTLRLGSYTIGEHFIGPEEQLELRVVEAMYLNQMPREAVIRTHQADLSKEHRAYTAEITGWDLTALDLTPLGTTKDRNSVRRWWKPWTW
jgi:hypothetical protein